MNTYAVLPEVRRIGFHGLTGDNRFPEDFPFPAALSSVVEYFHDPAFPVIPHVNNGETILERCGNIEFLAASGMAFGLLWSPEFDGSCLDFTLVNRHDQTIRAAFEWAGYACEILPHDTAPDNTPEARQKILAAIDAGIPVLGFGCMGFPECSLICGYDRRGEVLIGWSYFQLDVSWAQEENGMFRDGDWEKSWLKIVIPGEKTERRDSFPAVVERALTVMLQPASGPFAAGIAAYDPWIAFLENPAVKHWPDPQLKERHELHHGLIGSLAEARWWAQRFLLKQSKHPEILAAAECFKTIHELCWQLWEVLGAQAGPDLYKELRDRNKRRQLAALLTRVKAADVEAANHLQNALQAR